jgi:hypothetical protein
MQTTSPLELIDTHQLHVFLTDDDAIKKFSAQLTDNYADNNSKNVCATCWCFCNRYQTQKHKSDMGHTVLTPRYVKDWSTFRQLADQCQRFRVVFPEIEG